LESNPHLESSSMEASLAASAERSEFTGGAALRSDSDVVIPPAGPSTRTFIDGEVVAARFRIIRYIDAGGMGEVYEAEDLELPGERVALKTLLASAAGNLLLIDRLKAELSNNRKVAHRNVCRSFELFRHEGKGGSVLFVTMELLEGETLTSILRRKGRMRPAEILPIIRQVAEGLHAAHAANIVHQDLKPGNVMIVGEGAAMRAVITDFGLSRNLLQLREADSRSVGTLPYMAPEQLSGGAIDKRTDIYALGTMMYELLTDTWPFRASTPDELRRKKLTESPLPPARSASDVPAVWEKAVLRAIARDPQDRFSDALDFLRVLDGTAARRKRTAYAAVAAVLLISIAAGLSGFIARKWMAIHRTPAIAVLGLHNMSGDPHYGWLGIEIADGITTNLQQSKHLQAVSSDEVALARGEFPVVSQNIEREDLSAFRRAVGADYIVIGHFGVSGEGKQLFLDLKVQDPNGEFVGNAIHEEGADSDYRRLIADAAGKIRHALGSQALPEIDADEAANIFPQDAGARRLHFEALGKLRALDAVSAVEIEKQALRREGDNAAIHSALAEAYSQLKNMPAAREQAKRASELANAGHLPGDYKMAVEARLAELENDWPRAIERWNSLYSLTRENLGYGLLLANAQILGQQRSAALQTLVGLEKQPKPIGDDPRIPLAEAQAYSAGGEYQQEIRAASKALAAAKARSWKLMEARANLELCWAQQRAGADAEQSCNDARSLLAVFNDSVNSDVALNNIGNWLMQFNRYQEAKTAYERVIATMTAADDPRDAAGAHLNEATALVNLNDLKGAEEHIHHSLSLSVPIGDAYDEGRARVILADIKSRSSLREAESELQHALHIAEAADDLDTQGYAWTNLAEYQFLEGNLNVALSSAKQALKICRELKLPSAIAMSLEIMGGIQSARGALDDARTDYAEALEYRSDLDSARKAEVLISLAQVDFQGNHTDAATEEAQRAQTILRRIPNSNDDRATALVVLARVSTSKRDFAAAKRLLDQAQKLSPADDDVKTSILLAQGEASAATGDWAPAQNSFLAAKKNAEQSHNAYLALECRILSDKAAIAAGHGNAAEDLRKAAQEARKKNFSLLAIRAES
jgi:eukaryotic-like serine/threonine-protein kinase